MRIRTAIFSVYVAASAVGFSVLMRFMLAEVRPRYVRAMQATLQDTATAVAKALEGRTPAQAGAALGGLENFRARLMDGNGAVLFDSREPGPARQAEYAASPRGVARRIGSELIDGGADPNELEAASGASVNLAGGVPARLELSRSFRSVNAVIWAEREKLAVMGLAIAAIMVIAGWWIAAKLTDSLERLTIYVQDLRDRRAATPPVSRAREIAALTRAFEEMRDALDGRQRVERYTETLAHEVKSPLAAIRGAAELLDEEMPVEQRRKFLANIRSETARIQQLVERLLELSSLEARKELQRAEPLDAAELTAEAAGVVQRAYAAARVTLGVEGGGGVRLRGERVLLREALVNLLQNALEFSPAGAGVTLRAAGDAGRVVFTVEDAGPGVPDYALPRVFERFYSLPRPGTDRKSTGVGLPLVREIALLHEGGVSLENRAAGGARATLWLPAA
ncbi:MAG TPA: ATP-binding protein [Opitutus sp.]|nr:ATP-binding protein [Opitutus sp.]